MKIIVSHDVDHFYWSEHYFKDLYIPKLWFRSLKLLFTGVIDARTFFSRINCWSDKRIHRLEELVAFEKQLNIPATYFFVMQPGLGVAYEAEKVKPFLNELLKSGFSAGVHGMAYNDRPAMQQEFDRFKKLSGLSKFGIRMHYLRNDAGTREKLAATGYLFDSTDYNIAKPYEVTGMLEFPISIMDVYSVRPNHKTMDKAKQYTIGKLEEAEKHNIPFFVINFHDMLFDPAYKLYMDWFTWTIELCREKGFAFTNFNDAVAEYESVVV